MKAYDIYANISENEKPLVGHAYPFCDNGEIFYIFSHYAFFEQCFNLKDFEEFKKTKESNGDWSWVPAF